MMISYALPQCLTELAPLYICLVCPLLGHLHLILSLFVWLASAVTVTEVRRFSVLSDIIFFPAPRRDTGSYGAEAYGIGYRHRFC